MYRGELDLPAGTPPPAAAAARDSLAGAAEAAAALPGRLGAQVAASAREAFVSGMHTALLCAAVLAVAVAVFPLVALRRVPKVIEEAPEPEPVAAR